MLYTEAKIITQKHISVIVCRRKIKKERRKRKTERKKGFAAFCSCNMESKGMWKL
jgi:hypothetical protein